MSYTGVLWTSRLRGFNSNMVRLDGENICIDPGCSNRFNSNMVRLDVVIYCLYIYHMCSFNSNMVRLDEVQPI